MADLGVVFLPGIIGTELVNNGKRIWPGEFWELCFPYTHMAELTAPPPATVPRDIIKDYLGFHPVYSQILDHLNAVLPGRIYECPYDWRVANQESAKRLADKVDDAASRHSEIVILAHSMGGLVARYYLESGSFTARSGYSRVSTLITLATPHYGSPFALTAGLGFEKEEFLSKEQVYDLARRPEFPSVYQLLPPPGIPVLWQTDRALEPIDLYGPAGTMLRGKRGEQLNALNLKAAQDFWLSLKGRTKVRHFCFLGTQFQMIDSVSVSTSGAVMQAAKPDEIPCSGDGTVPSWSAALGHLQSMAVGGDHLGMVGDPKLHNALNQLLGVSQSRRLSTPVASVSLSRQVVAASTYFTAQVRFAPAHEISLGSIHIEPQAGYSLGRAPKLQFAAQIPNGSMLLEVSLKAPNVQGPYRISWVENGDVLASAPLIVQSPEPASEEDLREFRSMRPRGTAQ